MLHIALNYVPLLLSVLVVSVRVFAFEKLRVLVVRECDRVALIFSSQTWMLQEQRGLLSSPTQTLVCRVMIVLSLISHARWNEHSI